MTYFIADLHFGHANILKFDKRPWTNIDEHDSELIRRWNEAVGMDDEIYILGDISWHNAAKTVEIFSQLNGEKYLIRGNHDKRVLKSRKVSELFVEIADYKEIICDNRQIVLSHYPCPWFNGHFYNAIHLYGHVHMSFEWKMVEMVRKEMMEVYGKPCRMFHVGCMISYMEYRPRALSEILTNEHMEGK